MKNSFSLSSQQMQQKLCLCQQVIQYDRSESIELNSWWNFYTYSIYSLELRGPLLSEAPDILSTGRWFQVEKSPCYGLRSPFRAGRHLVHTQSPGPSSELSKRKWTQEHQNGFDSQTSLWDEGMREISQLHKVHCCHRSGWRRHLKRTCLSGCSDILTQCF